MSLPAPRWSAGNSPVLMVGWLAGLGAGLGLASVVLFPLAGFAFAAFWPAVAMALACGAVFAFVGTRMNAGGSLEADGLRARYLLRRARTWRYDEVAWAYLFRQRTSLLWASADDESLHLVTFDGTDLQLTLPARGARRRHALEVVAALPARIPNAYVGFSQEAARAWPRRGENPRSWAWLVERQAPEGRRLVTSR